jgi:hypothetical protein
MDYGVVPVVPVVAALGLLLADAIAAVTATAVTANAVSGTNVNLPAAPAASAGLAWEKEGKVNAATAISFSNTRDLKDILNLFLWSVVESLHSALLPNITLIINKFLKKATISWDS